MKRLAKLAALLGLAGTAFAGTSSPPAGNYLLNKSTTAAQPAFSVYGGTVTASLNVPYITTGQCVQTGTNGKLTGTGAPCGTGGGSSIYPSTATAFLNSGFTASTGTFSKQLKSAATGSGSSAGTGGAVLIDASADTGMPFQIYTSSNGQAGFFGLANLITANTNYANAYLYVQGTSSRTAKADLYLNDPTPNIQMVQSGVVSPVGQYEFMVTGDTLQFRAMNSGGSAYQPRVGMTHPGALCFYETSDNGHFICFKASGTIAANVTWVLPATDGTAGQVLSTDGSGNLSWANSGFIVAGSSIGSTTSTQPTYIYNPLITGGNPILQVRAENDFSGISGLTFSDRNINFKRVIAGPSATFSLSANGTGIATFNSDNNLCSDLSSVCRTRTTYLNGISGIVFDSTGKINTPYTSQHKTALLVVGGSSIFGAGYSDVGAMPTNGIRVIGQVIGQSSATFTGEVSAASMTTTGSGNGQIIMTVNGSTYSVISASVTPVVGNLAIFTSTNGTVGNGGTGGGGSGTPGSPPNSVQFNSAGSFAGSSNFNWSGSSLSVLGSVYHSTLTVVSNATASGNTGIPLVDVYDGLAAIAGTKVLLSIGTNQQNNQIVVTDQQPLDLIHYGVNAGGLRVGRVSNNEKIYSDQSTTQYMDWWNSGTMEFKTATSANGGKDIIFFPTQTETVRISTISVNVVSSMTVRGANGLGVTYGITAGSVTIPIGGNNYNVVSSSFVVPAGHHLVMNSANYTLGDGGTPLTFTLLSKTSDYVALNTDSVILASATTTSSFTVTLPTSASSAGRVLTISKVDISTGVVAIQAAGSDKINSTGTIKLNAFTQTASIMADGQGNWLPFGQGIQWTPSNISIPDGTSAFAVAATSSIYVCPVDIPVPVAAMGIRFGISIQGPSATADVGVYDQNGKLLASAGSTLVPAAGVSTLSFPTPVHLSPGQYYLAWQGNATGTQIVGTVTQNRAILCATNTATTMGLPASFTFGTTSSRIPSLHLIVSGGRLTE